MLFNIERGIMHLDKEELYCLLFMLSLSSYCRYACSIPNSESGSVIITGGYHTTHTVSRYGISGWSEDLPSLNHGRAMHGCGSYQTDSGEMEDIGTYITIVGSFFLVSYSNMSFQIQL